MTVWQDRPPQTRREARERERALQASAQGNRRASTAEPTTAGDEPVVSTSQETRPAETAPHHGADHRAQPAEASDFFVAHRPEEGAKPVTVPVALVAEPDTRPPLAEEIVPERTMTRRELRALLQAQEANQQAGEQAAPDAAVVAPSVAPPSSDVPQPRPEAPQATPQQAPVAPRPAGHWSVVRDSDEQALPFDALLAQHVDSAGSGSATSSLILPVIPSAPDAMGPLTSTGEILVTGSLDLPRSLGATGQHPDRYDSSDMDRMFEAETDVNTSTVAPIRASRAVSTHTSTRGMIAPPKKRGGRLPIILAVTAAVLLVGVIALVVAGFVFKVF